MSIHTLIKNQFTDPYAAKSIYETVLGYMLPDYRPKYNEVIKELSSFHFDNQRFDHRVYDTEFVFNYFDWLHIIVGNTENYTSKLSELLGLPPIEEEIIILD